MFFVLHPKENNPLSHTDKTAALHGLRCNENANQINYFVIIVS